MGLYVSTTRRERVSNEPEGISHHPHVQMGHPNTLRKRKPQGPPTATASAQITGGHLPPGTPQVPATGPRTSGGDPSGFRLHETLRLKPNGGRPRTATEAVRTIGRNLRPGTAQPPPVFVDSRFPSDAYDAIAGIRICSGCGTKYTLTVGQTVRFGGIFLCLLCSGDGEGAHHQEDPAPGTDTEEESEDEVGAVEVDANSGAEHRRRGMAFYEYKRQQLERKGGRAAATIRRVADGAVRGFRRPAVARQDDDAFDEEPNWVRLPLLPQAGNEGADLK